MSNEAWLSVVMPSYNSARWIGHALESVAAEPSGGIEVIVVDGSPGPAPLEIADRFRGRLNLRAYHRPDLETWQAKTNFGSELATAPHLCWLHTDDVWLPGRVAAVRRWIAQDASVVLHLAPSRVIDAAGRFLATWHCPLPGDGPVAPDTLVARLLVQNTVSTPAPVFSASAWRRSGGLDGALWYTADWDIWFRIAAQGPVRYHAGPTTGFRVHGHSLTATGSRDSADFRAQMERVLATYLPLLGARARAVERTARASIAVNTALAAAAAGDRALLAGAALALLRLGPLGMSRYVQHSRILDRLLPRLRAKLAGAY